MAPVTRSQIRSITAALKLRPTDQPSERPAIPTVTETKKRKQRNNKPKPKPKIQPGETFTPEPKRSREVFPVPRPLSPISNMFETIFKKFYSLSKSDEDNSKPKKRVRFDLSNIQKKSPTPCTSKKGNSYFRKRSATAISSKSVSPDTTTETYPSTSIYAGPHNSIRSVRSNDSNFLMDHDSTTSFISSDFEQSRENHFPDSPNTYMNESAQNCFQDYDQTNNEVHEYDKVDEFDYLEDNFENKMSADEYEQEMVVENEFEEGILPNLEENEIKIEEEVIQTQDHEMIVVGDIIKQEDILGQEVIVDNEVEIELVVREDIESMEYEDEGICEDSAVFSDSNSSFFTDNAPASNERSLFLNLDLNKIFGEMDVEEIEKDAINAFSVLTGVLRQHNTNKTNFYNKNIDGDGKEKSYGEFAVTRRNDHAQTEGVHTQLDNTITNPNAPTGEGKTRSDKGCILVSSGSVEIVDSSAIKTEYSAKKDIFLFKIKREYYSSLVNIPAKKIKKEFLIFNMSGTLGYVDAITTCVEYRPDNNLDNVQLDSDIEDETLTPYDANNVTEVIPKEESAADVDQVREDIPKEKITFIPGKRPLTPTKTLRTLTGKLVTSVSELLQKRYSVHACPEEGCNYVSVHLQKVVSHYVISHRDKKDMYLFRCTECREKFATKEILEIHRKSHLSFNICHLCLNCFPSSPYLEEHVKFHRNMSHITIKCNFCDLHFPSKLYLERHLISEQRLLKMGFSCYHKKCRYAIPQVTVTNKKVTFNLKRQVIENRTYLSEEKVSPEKIEPQDEKKITPQDEKKITPQDEKKTTDIQITIDN